MLLGSNLLDQTKDEFLRNLATLGSARDTLVFLDTNIFAYLYKLHAAARQEFFAWTDSAVTGKRLYIPGWCAGEYLARLRGGQLHSYTPKSKEADAPRKSLESMLDTASLFVDEKVLNGIGFPGSRNDYLTGFREAIDALKQYTSAFKHQFDPEEIHEEIQAHLGAVVLDSPLAQLCDRASKEGPARIEHRLPPAYRDDGKLENRLGDLIIWLEILQYCESRKDDYANVLFLSNDEKSDWVYSPLKRIEEVDSKRKPVPNKNPELRIIDPRLVSEFRRVVGHGRITICSLAALVQGISKTRPSSVSQLAAAIQIDSSVEGGATQGAEAQAPSGTATTGTRKEYSEQAAGQASSNPQEGTQSDTLPAPVSQEDVADELSYDLDGYRDSAYEFDAPGELNEIIRALRSHNWYTQNPAIEQIKSVRKRDFPPTAWFVLGRNIYQAACGNAQKAMDFMVNLDIQLKRFSGSTPQHLLAGIVFEIYFDNQGEMRLLPKSGYFAKPLAVLASAGYERVRAFIRAKLQEAGARLLFFPGDDKKFSMVIESQEVSGQPNDSAGIFEKARLLTSVQLEGIELLTEGERDSIGLWSSFTSSSYLPNEIVEEVSSALLIPRWAIASQFTPVVRPGVRFVVPEGWWLRARNVTEKAAV